MATQNFFALLGDDENDDPQVLISKAQGPVVEKAEKKAPKPAVKGPCGYYLSNAVAPPSHYPLCLSMTFLLPKAQIQLVCDLMQASHRMCTQ